MEEISTLISQQFTNVGILKIEQVRQVHHAFGELQNQRSDKKNCSNGKGAKNIYAGFGWMQDCRCRLISALPKKDGSVSSKSRYRIVYIRRYPKTHPKICDRDNLKTRHITNAIAEAFGVADRAERVSFMDTL